MAVLGDVTVAGSSGEVLTDVDGSSVRVARVAFASVLVTRVKSWIFLVIPPGVSWKSPTVKFVGTVMENGHTRSWKVLENHFSVLRSPCPCLLQCQLIFNTCSAYWFVLMHYAVV